MIPPKLLMQALSPLKYGKWCGSLQKADYVAQQNEVLHGAAAEEQLNYSHQSFLTAFPSKWMSTRFFYVVDLFIAPKTFYLTRNVCQPVSLSGFALWRRQCPAVNARIAQSASQLAT